MTTSSFLRVTFLLLTSMALPVPAQNVEEFGIIFFHQEGSGLRVVGIGSDLGRKQVGTFLRLKNYTPHRVVGFQVVFVAAGDTRLEPSKKVGPRIVKRSHYIETAIDPGELYDVYNIGPALDEFLPWLKDAGVRYGLVRAGISRVVYADGSEQNFDLLKDEQATKSAPPPDTGGHPNPFVKPVSAISPRLVLARANLPKRSCTFRIRAIPAATGRPYLYSDSESWVLPVSLYSSPAQPPTPSNCNFAYCAGRCIDWPDCAVFGPFCSPASYNCVDGPECATYLCIF